LKSQIINKKIFIIAEVAQAHDGSLGIAHAFIDSVSKTGADAIKFQTHIAEAETTRLEPWRIKFSTQDRTRYDYWKRMEFSEEQWRELKKHSKEVGLKFISSPFSIEAVDLLNNIGVYMWKIPSGEITNFPMLEAIIDTEKDIIISTGMSPLSEIDNTVKFLSKAKSNLTVLQCTSMYPTPPENIGLDMIEEYRKRYSCDVGLSDHSGKIYAGLAAATLGIDVLEVHVTLSKDMFGPDVTSSITILELTDLVQGIRFIEKINLKKINKDKLARELEPMRKIFTKSIYYKNDIKKDVILKKNYLQLKKPGDGVGADQLGELIGRRMKKGVKKGEKLSLSDIV
jgi:N-acetylneuraminate synthase|tara:strand:- start:4084 stop:5106 length:1023 start_codon:yes stop_codon:yes gene_type:complete